MKKLILLCLVLCLSRLNAQVCFKAPQTYTASYNTYAIRDADFDGNGIPDMVASSCSTTVLANLAIYMNYSSTTLSFSTTTNVPINANSNATDIAVADFDGDGKQDIITVNNNLNNVAVLPGNGNGTFGTAITFTTINAPKSIAIADFDGNGRQDMAIISNAYNSMAIHLNVSTSGSFSFSPPATHTITSPYAIDTADFNGDTHTDIAVVSNTGGNVYEFLNSGTGTFGSAATFSLTSGSSPYDLTTGDFNNDGKIDIATADNNYSNTLSVLLGTGTAGSFSTAVGYYVGNNIYPQAVITIDFNDDGYLDLAAVGTTSMGINPSIEVLLGTGLSTGTFGTSAVSFNANISNSYPVQLLTGDYNLDGNADLAITQYSSNSVGIYLNAKPVISGVTTICTGASTTLTATSIANTYTWNTSATTASVSLTPTVTTTYTVTSAVAGSCSVSTVETVTVNPLPPVYAGASQSICVGDVATYTASGALTYSWSTGATTPTATISPTSSTFIAVTGIDANGCSNTATSSVTVNSLPTITATATPSVICIGASTTLTATGSASTYSWSTGFIGATITDFPSASTAYTVTGTDANNCVNTATTSVIVNSNPGISINSASICLGQQTATLTASSGTATSYSWSPATGLSATSGSVVTGNPTTTTDYTVAGTDVNGCSTLITTTITVNPLPTVTVNNATICPAYTTTLTANGASFSYSWSTGANTQSITVNPLTTTAYTVIGTDVNFCTDMAIANVTVNLFDDLSGTIYDTTTVSGVHQITNGGIVYLYPVQSTSTAIDTAGLLPTSAVSVNISNVNGSYSFSQVASGSYYLKAVADTHFYHGAVPTYSSTKLNPYRWDSAVPVIHVGCNNGNDAGHDITIIELPALSGTGIISGTVTTAQSFGQRMANGGHNQTMGAPIKGIDVKLGRNPGGSCAAMTTADTNGVYKFTGVDTGSYSIYVDIPNFGMVTILTATLTPTNLQSTNNNYCVDSTNIGVGVCFQAGIKQITDANSQVAVYPNPNNGSFIIKGTDEVSNLRIINELGQIIQTISLKQTNNYEVSLTGLDKGVYYLLGNSNATQTKQCIIVIN